MVDIDAKNFFNLYMIILDDSKTYPKNIIDQLNQRKVIDLLMNNLWIENIKRDRCIVDIFEDVEKYCNNNGIVGFHCTKEIHTKPYHKTGLRILNMRQHHSEFIQYLKDELRISKEDIVYFKEKLDYFRENNSEGREGTLWFCLNRNFVGEDSEDFLKYYGGEAVYFWFKEDRKITKLCKSIGKPVVIEALIEVSELTIFQEYGFGKTLVSNYAHSINKKFHTSDLEGFVKSDIPSKNIIQVHPKKSFFKKYHQVRNDFNQ
ncbi:hypothetical protein [Leptospira alstonii]|uniref:Uncharacterized protein n=1 Tax=Leptospira alstonii serovar Sichuan str. 79601 TaxID=1218565 RepID=M6CYB6_9LEPT|nr:hypothetical protein [Leptospira alstonii]AGS80468.1 hypothetical protein LEP1GSC193_0774 [Leptospira phage vB_LalZ_80412-LE1]EMJ95471.1 hypothetical protein LEP1GSC194_3574 [Leptospira alstonii serovar Sichuan str. 79601]